MKQASLPPVNFPSKFLLYEKFVQSPEWKVHYLPQFHQHLVRKKAKSFREDFCGSGKIACEWVKQGSQFTAQGLDLDSETLAYAEDVNRAALSRGAQRRVQFLRQDVSQKTSRRFDMIGAFNYSFFDFHDRKSFLKYARAAFHSLETKGTLFLELAGGPDFTKPLRDEAFISARGLGKIKCVWEQHDFDPIAQVCDYSIHFQNLKTKEWLYDAFHYHWRIWSIREMREVLIDAGFATTAVLWDTEEQVDDYQLVDHAENRPWFNAYVVGVKSTSR